MWKRLIHFIRSKLILCDLLGVSGIRGVKTGFTFVQQYELNCWWFYCLNAKKVQRMVLVISHRIAFSIESYGIRHKSTHL